MKRVGLFIGFVFVSAFMILNILVASPAFAQSAGPAAPTGAVTTTAASGRCSSKNSFFGFPTWYKYLPLDANCDVITTGLGGEVVLLILMAIIEILLFLAGFLAGFMIIYGAFRFITSQGDSGKVVAARTTVANAVIGLVIAVVASRVVSFIAARLTTSAVSGASTGSILSGSNIPKNVADAAAIQNLLGFVFALAGAIALLVITFAGFNFVTSQGEPQKVATARMTILYAIVGLVISVFSFTIVKLVLGKA
jgi:hypothetical protein